MTGKFNQSTGTPKSIKQAVFNAFEERNIIASEETIKVIIKHVHEFCAQKFCVLNNDPAVEKALIEVFKKIFPE